MDGQPEGRISIPSVVFHSHHREPPLFPFLGLLGRVGNSGWLPFPTGPNLLTTTTPPNFLSFPKFSLFPMRRPGPCHVEEEWQGCREGRQERDGDCGVVYCCCCGGGGGGGSGSGSGGSGSGSGDDGSFYYRDVITVIILVIFIWYFCLCSTLSICLYLYVLVYLYVSMFICMYVYNYVYSCMYVCIYVLIQLIYV